MLSGTTEGGKEGDANVSGLLSSYGGIKRERQRERERERERESSTLAENSLRALRPSARKTSFDLKAALHMGDLLKGPLGPGFKR